MIGALGNSASEVVKNTNMATVAMQFEKTTSDVIMYADHEYPSISAMMPDEIEIVFEYPENYDEEKEYDNAVGSIWEELPQVSAMTSTATACTTPTGPLSAVTSGDSTTSQESQDRLNKEEYQATQPTPPPKAKYSAYATPAYISTSSRQLYNQRFQYQRRIHTQHFLPPLQMLPPLKQQRREEVEQEKKLEQPLHKSEENETSQPRDYSNREGLESSPPTTNTNMQQQKFQLEREQQAHELEVTNHVHQHKDREEEEPHRIPSIATTNRRQRQQPQQNQWQQEQPKEQYRQRQLQQALAKSIPLGVDESSQRNRNKEEESKRRPSATTNIDLDYPFFETQTSWVEFRSSSIMWRKSSFDFEAANSRPCDVSSVTLHNGSSDGSSYMNIKGTIPVVEAIDLAAPPPPTATTTISHLSELETMVSRPFPLSDIKSRIVGNNELQRNNTRQHDKQQKIFRDDDRNRTPSRKPSALYHLTPTTDTEEEELGVPGIFMQHNATDNGDGKDDEKLLMHGHHDSFDYDSHDFGDEITSLSARTQHHSRTNEGEKKQRRRLRSASRSILSRLRGYHDCPASSHAASKSALPKKRKKRTSRNVLPSSSRSIQTRLEAVKHQMISKPKKLISKPIRQSILAVKENIVPFACCVGSASGGYREGNIDEDEGTMILIDRVYSDDNDDYVPPPAPSADIRDELSHAPEPFISDIAVLRNRVLEANDERPNLGKEGGVSVFDLLQTSSGVGRLNLESDGGQTWRLAEF